MKTLSRAVIGDDRSGCRRNLLLRFTVAVWLIAACAGAMDFPVTAPGDGGGLGTLRSQINNALVNGPNNSVSFPSTFTATSIGLVMGELVINKNLTIQGPGATNMLVFNNSGRVFHITSGANVVISGLTLTGTVVGTNGANGTGAMPDGQSGETVNGGGILNEASCQLTLGQCVMSNCTATAGDGGDAYTNIATSPILSDGGQGGAASGGALANDGDCVLVGCTFVDDFSRGGAGGKGRDGGLGGPGGDADGGAVQVEYNTSALSIVNCTFNGNAAVGGAGGRGGDAFNLNIKADGGAGGPGGGALGGAIDVLKGCPDATCDGLLHCTISGNECAPGFGAFGGFGVNGGANGATGVNGLPDGCGVFFDSMNKATFLPIGNSIIAGNFCSSGFTPFGPDVGGPFPKDADITSNTHNLIGIKDGSGPWSPLDLTGPIGTQPLNPVLGPLQLNAGQTPTMAPLACSPAIDAGTAEGQPVDQAGQNRTVPLITAVNGSDGTDIGAYELQVFPTVKLNIVQANGNITLSWPAPDDSCFILQQSTDMFNWMDANDQVNLTGNQNQVVIPEPVDGNLFFRLRHP